MNRANRKSAEIGKIWIFDEIGDWYGLGPKAFREELDKLGSVDVLEVHINSPGGSVYDGIAIYNALASHPARVEIEIDGLAASIASVIAMAGDSIKVAENATMMIHDAWSVVIGNAEAMRKEAEILDQINQSIANTYARRNTQDATAEQILDLMSEELWMMGPEIVDMGFADELGQPLKAAARFDLDRFGYVHPPANAQEWDGPIRARTALDPDELDELLARANEQNAEIYHRLIDAGRL